MRRWITALAATAALAAGTIEEAMRAYETLKPGEKAVARGVFYYSSVMRIDTDNDGRRNRVVMAAKLFVKQTPEGYRGYLVRGLLDLDSGRIDRLYIKSNPEGRQSPAGNKIDLRDIALEGKTLTFTFYGLRYRVTDGGEGWQKDRVSVRTRHHTKTLSLHGGDIEVGL